jgi:hypothetical protein
MCYLLRILCLPGEVKAIVSHLPAGATWHNTGPFAATARCAINMVICSLAEDILQMVRVISSSVKESGADVASSKMSNLGWSIPIYY